MKKNLFYAMAIAAAFTACSEDNEAVKNPSAEANKGYMTFNVSLPSMATTRAANDQFAEDKNEEYMVKDITICLLNENEQIIQVSKPTTTWTDPGDNVNVQRISSTIEVKTTQTPKWALVVLNNKNNITMTEPVSNDGNTTYTKWENTVLDSKTASSFIEEQDNNSGIGKYITMTNALIVAGEEGNKSIQGLTPITSDNLKNTQSEAEDNAVEVYVERIVAKVSVGNKVSSSNTTFSGTDGNELLAGVTSIELQTWELDYTNTSTFPVRKTTGENCDWLTGDYNAGTEGSNRMIGGSNTTPQRVYWAVDNNYSADATSGELTTLEATGTVDNTLTQVDYCLENTFDTDHQMQDQTTRVVFKTKIKPSADNYAANENLFTIGGSSQIWTATDLATQIKTYATEAGVTTGEAAKTTLTSITTAGEYTLDNASVKTIVGASTDITNEQLNEITAKLGTINCYVEGICYYVARIKHFGDDLTPWTVNNATYGTTDEAKKFLGRYGVVRNNWYDLTVTGIKKLGTPTIPTPKPSTPDDEKEQFMVYKINILSWAKRSQDVEL